MSLMIEGGRRLSGDLTVQGAKNSVLPILAACILSGDVCILQRCPHLEDVDTSIDILRHLGCAVRWNGPDLEVDSSTLTRWDIPDRLMRRMRSSVVFLGAILARCGQAELSYPGGCAIGARPIDLHLSALRTLGACIREEGGSLDCTASGLAGAEIVLSIPSVGATENAMLAAVGAEGITVIENAACEPSVPRASPPFPTLPGSRRSWTCRPFCKSWGPAFTAQAPPPWSSKARRSRSMAAATGF